MNIPLVNKETASLAPYPMEELSRIKRSLKERKIRILDFGTGDPRIPTWGPIREALIANVASISQYPSILGMPSVNEAFWGYLNRRFSIIKDDTIASAPSSGSKEAIFHVALSLVGRGGRKRVVYPDPGYPVYRSSTLFAGGIPTPIELKHEDQFLLKPWTLPRSVVSDIACVWVNYPHNPIGAIAPASYWEELIAWCHKEDIILLSDECYVDLYDEEVTTPPLSVLSFTRDRVLSFMSLSKRSGMTGYRSGFMVGDARLIKPMLQARANFGVGMPDFTQHAAVVAWNDDAHVSERRAIFNNRMRVATQALQKTGALSFPPVATFYLWCRLPPSFGNDDIRFCLKLAEEGVIATPSSWLSENVQGYFRLAMVEDEPEIREAMKIICSFYD